MTSAKSVGRAVGIVSMLRIFVAPPAYFVLLPPATNRDFLATAAASEPQARLALLLTFVLGALTFAIAMIAYPFLRRYSERLALTLLLLSVIGAALLALDGAGIMRMLALSEEYARPGAPAELLQPIGRAARVAWIWAHFTNLTVGHLSGLVFSLILYRHALVPRALAGFALAASVLGAIGVAMPLLDRPWPRWTVAPAGLAQLALMGWLIVRGFSERALDSRAA